LSNPEVESWSKVARALGASLHIRHIYVGPRNRRTRFGLPSLTASIGGAEVVGEVSGEGDPPATFANLSVRVPGAARLSMRVYRSYVYPQIGRVLGAEDVVVGDPHFDRTFIVKSSDPYDARLWLPPEVRRFISQAPDFCFDVDSERATASSHRCDDPAQIESAMRALAALAQTGRRLDDGWNRLGKRLDAAHEERQAPWLSESSPTMTFTSGGREMILDIAHRATGQSRKVRLLTRLQCRRLSTRRDRFVLYRDVLARKDRPRLASKLARSALGSLHPKGFVVHAGNLRHLEERLEGRWIRAFESLQPLVLTCTEALVELWWPGAVFDEQRIRLSAELCEHFATDAHLIAPSGPYR
jgi:hypothetical protein